ncbi:MAG: TetR/AcrR family transcriptional regulator [Caldilineaceae bacterium]
MTELSPREKRQQRTYQAILDAARQIITAKGVEALSMRGLARAIEYSPAALYEYFGSKEEIIQAVVEQGFERFTGYLDRVDKALPAAQYVTELGMAYINFAVQNPDFFLLMFTTAPLAGVYSDMASSTEAIAHLKAEPSFSILLRGVERAIAESVAKTGADYGAFEIAYALWTQVHGMAMLQVTNLRHMPYDFEQINRLSLHIMYVGLAAG